MSLSKVFANPMLNTTGYLNAYTQQLVDLDNKGLLPRLDVNLTYNVYSVRGSAFGAHKSIVLSTDDQHFITVELGFIIVNGKKHIYPVTKELSDARKSKLEYHGTIYTKGKDLIAKAVEVMDQFGQYFKFCNNCQNYCNYYLKAIGLPQAQKLTDGDKVTIGVTVGVATASLLIGLTAALLRKKK